MARTAAWIFWPSIVAATAFAEEPNKDVTANAERSYYASIKEDVKQEYETALALFYQQGVMKDASKDLQAEAIDAIKMTYYNKASIRTACVVESITATNPSQPPTNREAADIKARYNECADRSVRNAP